MLREESSYRAGLGCLQLDVVKNWCYITSVGYSVSRYPLLTFGTSYNIDKAARPRRLPGERGVHF